MDRLYRSPWACLAVLRALPPLGKHYAMRLLYVEDGVPVADMDHWVRPGCEGVHRASVEHMRRLRVLTTTEGGEGDGKGRGGGALARLSRRFQRGLRAMLERSFRVEGAEDAEVSDDLASHVPSLEALDAFAKGRWEALLLTLTGASDAFEIDLVGAKPNAKKGKGAKSKTAGAARPPLDVAALFRAANLVGDPSKGEREGVTEAGFRFLLDTAREQIWMVLTQYVSRYVAAAAAAAPMEIDLRDGDGDEDEDIPGDGDIPGDEDVPGDLAPAVIAFLLKLTFQRPGRPYPTDGLPEAQRAVVRDLAHLGLLYPLAAPDGKGYYVPTYLTAGLSSGDAGGGDGAGTSGDVPATERGHEGHVIVETNYRVYAYTSSAVEVEILRLFTRPDYRLPNLYVGMLTREAVLEALASGISAEQIVKYLRAHAHPQTRKTPGPPVPTTVCDQIRLWARERTRVREAPAVLYCDFPTGTGMFDTVASAASERGVLLWEDREGLRLAVASDGHEDMKAVFAAIRAGDA